MTKLQTRKRAALWLAAVFVAGAFLGVAGTTVFSGRHHPWSDLSPGEYRSRLLVMLTKELGLDAEQQQEVELILDEIGERFRLVREAVEPEFEAIRSERADRIVALLDAEQQVKYEQILEERRRRREEHENRNRIEHQRNRR